MKNITTKIALFIAAAALCVSINACKKSTTDSDLSTAQDEAQAENESNYIQNAADAGAGQSTSGPRSTETGGWQIFKCATISFAANDTSTGPKTMYITFDGTCTGIDGKIRKGQIIVTWTGRYRDSGTVIHTYTNGYIVNGNPHNYSKWVTNVGPVNGLYTFDILDTAKIITTTGTISWTSSRTRTWTSGYNAPWWQWWTSVYSITGSANGTDRKGLAFSVNITKPILVDFSCYWLLTQGTYDIAIQGKAARIIDFGSGTCDDNATCTINGVTYAFQFGNY